MWRVAALSINKILDKPIGRFNFTFHGNKILYLAAAAAHAGNISAEPSNNDVSSSIHPFGSHCADSGTLPYA